MAKYTLELLINMTTLNVTRWPIYSFGLFDSFESASKYMARLENGCLAMIKNQFELEELKK
jgi:hypothetical protein